MKISFELQGWFPEMLKALKENRKMDSDYNSICKVLVESWLLDHQDSFQKEYAELFEA